MNTKFYRFLLIAFVGLMSVTACTKTELIENNYYNGRSLWINVPSSQWTANTTRELWTLRVNVPEIDNQIVENGTVLVDISFGDGIFEPLSRVNTNGVSYRYDYSIGELYIEASYSDGFGGELPRPANSTLKILLFDADPIN